jgi:hypothetical protein
VGTSTELMFPIAIGASGSTASCGSARGIQASVCPSRATSATTVHTKNSSEM